jgi:tetratricopeptide (TPR) repeat protein
MSKFFVIAVLAVLPLMAQEEALKQRVQARSQAVVELLTAGVLSEGVDGLLKPVGQIEPSQSQTMREENQDREAIFQLIAERSHVPVEEVRSMYSKRARVKFPVTSAGAGAGPCKLVAAKAPDVERLLHYLKQGMMYASQKKFDLALAEFQPALNIDKNFLSLNQNVGSAQLALKKYAEAEAAFKAEVKLTECLSGLNDNQLASFGYFFEVAEKDAAARKRAQAEKLKAELPKARANAHYNLACAYSLQKQKDPALAALRAAVDAGFADKKSLNGDSDLAFVRQAPEFKEIAAKIK